VIKTCHTRTHTYWRNSVPIPRGFKDFYNRRYFLNFRRYLKKLGYLIKKLGEKIQALCMVFILGEI
jgi:hypothetical protein